MNRTIFKHLHIFLTTIIFCCQASAQASEITIASGAGYKRPLQEINTLYMQQTGNSVSAVYGNMFQIISQADMSGRIAIMIGDQNFFDRSQLDFSRFQTVGQGRLVLAWRSGLEITGIEDITSERIERIGLPAPAKAIYGKAAMEYLENSGLMNRISGKLLKLSTVPQVSSYLISKEIDAGFINLTDAKGITEKIGGYLPAETTLYQEITISAGVLEGFENSDEVSSYLDFLESREARNILSTYGL
ncbi:MAG: molybdate ABC transporter substrate-binding protein [Prosthecochloris sp.]|nr:molybdate ABC transporter substrate-binding protein [Prosthecochloris sp.]